MKYQKMALILVGASVLLGACGKQDYATIKDTHYDKTAFMKLANNNEDDLAKNVLKRTASKYYNVSNSEIASQVAYVEQMYTTMGKTMSDKQRTEYEKDLKTSYAIDKMLNAVLKVSDKTVTNEMKKNYKIVDTVEVYIPDEKTDAKTTKTINAMKKELKALKTNAQVEKFTSKYDDESGTYAQTNSYIFTESQLKSVDLNNGKKGYISSNKMTGGTNLFLVFKSEKAKKDDVSGQLTYQIYKKKYQSIAKFLEAFDKEKDDVEFSEEAMKLLKKHDTKMNLIDDRGNLFTDTSSTDMTSKTDTTSKSTSSKE